MVIQCYASTADKLDEDDEQFYNEIEQLLAETPKQNILVTGNFIARVGKNAEEKVLGKYGHGDRNEQGQVLVNFSAEHRLVITSTLFCLHNRHRYT